MIPGGPFCCGIYSDIWLNLAKSDEKVSQKVSHFLVSKKRGSENVPYRAQMSISPAKAGRSLAFDTDYIQGFPAFRVLKK